MVIGEEAGVRYLGRKASLHCTALHCTALHYCNHDAEGTNDTKKLISSKLNSRHGEISPLLHQAGELVRSTSSSQLHSCFTSSPQLQ
jgi:hypothetical protein